MEGKMEKQPLISVVMPCFNHEKYVAQAIESVLNQTYKNIEFIIVDNGSTDHSFEIIRQYSDRVSKIYQLKENDLIRAGRILIDACNGEYIAFMTSDDCWEKTKLEKQMYVFDSMPTVKCCFTWANEADENMEKTSPKSIFIQENRSRFEWIRRLLEGGNCLAYPSAVVEKAVYIENLKRLKHFYQLGDWYLWLLILLEYDIYVVQEPLVCFRWHESGENHNMSAQNDKSLIRSYNETADAIEEIIETMDKITLKNTFSDLMLNADCTTENELKCEKLFILMELSKRCALYEPSVINYYYKQSKNENFLYTLKEKYNYSYVDFQSYSGEHGIGNLVYQMCKLQSQKDTQLFHMQMMANVLCSDLDVDERKKILRKKNVSASNIQTEMIKLTIKTLEVVEKNCQERTTVLHILQQLHVYLSSIWNDILMWDVDVGNDEWENYCETIQNQDTNDEVNYESVIVFIQKVKLILKDCIET